MDTAAREALLSGPVEWEQYRSSVGSRRIDLSDADLNGANLEGLNLKSVNLTRASMVGASLINADLTEARLTTTNLRRADLTRAALRGAYLFGADLTDANLTNADLSRADLSHVDARDAELYGANFTLADLQYARFVGANLTGADLTEAILRGAALEGAYLTGAIVDDADLSGANLADAADLTDVDLSASWLDSTYPNEEGETAFNFELDEIATALTRADAVREAVAVHRAGLICGYIVARDGLVVEIDDVRRTAATVLPTYLVPTVFIVVDRLPRLLNGRVDRAALPQPILSEVAEAPPPQDPGENEPQVPALMPGEVRLAIELPDGMAPQDMAEMFQALSVLASTAVVVGPRLRDTWFEPPEAVEGTTVVVATDPGDNLPIAIRRIRYGSTFVTDFLDPWIGYVAAAGLTGAGVHRAAKRRANAPAAESQSNSYRLLSLLLTLARPAERKLWLQRRVERQQTLLSEQQSETRLAEERGMKAGRRMAEHTVETLRIAAKSDAEIRQSFESAGGDSDNVGKVVPLFRHGVTVTTTELGDDRPALPPPTEPA